MAILAAYVRGFLLGTGILCVGYWSYATLHSEIVNARDTARLARMIRADAEKADADFGDSSRTPGAGALLGRIDIPRVGVDTVVLEGTESDWLSVAAGHVVGTALPGSKGNVVIAAHRDSFFRGLRRIRVGDLITLTTPRRRLHYVVAGTDIIDPSDTGVLRDSANPTLTLLTCYPFHYIGSAPKRFVVHADEVSGKALAEAQERAAARQRAAAAHSEEARPQRGVVGARDGDHPTAPSETASASDGGAAKAARHRLPWWKRLFHHHRQTAAE
jgi:sortase A